MVSGCWYTPPLFFVALVPVLGVLFVADPESPNIFGVCLGLKSEEMLKILNEEEINGFKDTPFTFEVKERVFYKTK